jgi:hypothetical protein
MSDVEKFWDAVSSKFGKHRRWNQLSPQEQQQVVMGINLILAVLYQ